MGPVRRLIGRPAAMAGAMVLALAAAGAVYQMVAVRRDASRFPPPGALVDVGGRRLHVVCEGQGSTAVVFESSGLGTSLSSERVRAEVRARTRTCAYDRMGMGWSDPGPRGISAGVLADDLERLLARAAIPPRYVIVAASIGGMVAELFARRHPGEIAALVFVDGADSVMLERAASQITRTQIEGVCLARVAATLGVLRLLDPLRVRREGDDQSARTVALTYRAEPMATLCGLARGLRTSLAELRAAPPLPPEIPIVALTHDRPEGFLPPGYDVPIADFEAQWREMQQRLAARSRYGSWRVVPGSGHLIAATQPHAVAAAVLDVLSQAR